jgi:hypothetical protein
MHAKDAAEFSKPLYYKRDELGTFSLRGLKERAQPALAVAGTGVAAGAEAGTGANS